MTRRIALLGTGAIGSSIGADLAVAGHDVVLIDQEHSLEEQDGAVRAQIGQLQHETSYRDIDKHAKQLVPLELQTMLDDSTDILPGKGFLAARLPGPLPGRGARGPGCRRGSARVVRMFSSSIHPQEKQSERKQGHRREFCG